MSHASPAVPDFGLPLSAADLRRAAAEHSAWLWEGYLAPGNITLLVSQWKAGKTTLTALLLERMRAGGQLAGRAVLPGKVIVVSEEPARLWEQRCQLFNLDGHVHWFCRPFQGTVTRELWNAFVDHLLTLHRQVPYELLVIDPLLFFLPGGKENSPAAILDFIASLRKFCALGVAVLILHHPRKDNRVDGQASRGCGALPGAVDILTEMHWFSRGADGDRRRKLLAWARQRDVPHQLVIEMNEAGTDYAALGTLEDVHTRELHRGLQRLFDTAQTKMTRRELLEAWPPEEPRPHPSLLWRWLNQAVLDELVRCQGEGTKSDPLRYWTPAREKEWRKDPIKRLELEDEDSLRKLYQDLETRFMF